MGLFSKRGSKRRTAKEAKKSSRGTKSKTKGTEKGTDKKSSNTKYSKRRSSRQKSTRGSSNTHTRSKSHPPTPEKEREGRKREKKEDSGGGGKDDKGSQVILASNQPAKPRCVRIGSREVDDETVERVFEKFTKERKEAPPPAPGAAGVGAPPPLDEKARLLMDRVTKKPMKSERSEMFYDEMSSFQKKKPTPSVNQKAPTKKVQEESVFFDDDSYSQVPKLINVRKMSGENVYTERGVPYWTEPLEPTDEERETTAEAIMVSNPHIELVHNKTITLLTNPVMSLELNEFLHLSELMKRDEAHFDARLVFSNTIRTFMLLDPSDELKKLKKEMEELIDTSNPKEGDRKVKFHVENPTVAVLYSRTDPIQSIREMFSSRVSVTTTLTTTSTSSRDENN